jgi:hypothetical protein
MLIQVLTEDFLAVRVPRGLADNKANEPRYSETEVAIALRMADLD